MALIAEQLRPLAVSIDKINHDPKNARLHIGNRVLYPDGTANSFVQRYLREQVVKLFEAKAKSSVKKS